MAAGPAVDARLSARARNVTDTRGGALREDLISFAYGFPDPASLPLDGIADAAARAMRGHGQWPLQYGPTSGFDGLIDLLVEKLGRDQGIACSRDDLLVTAGGSQALALLCDLFLDPGDTILSEEPVWLGAVRLFGNISARVEGVPLDEDGVRVDVLEERLRALHARGVAPKAFYTIPNFQNPTGVTTTRERRERIVELADRYNFAIFEDDAYHDLRFSGERVPTIYGLDGGRHALYFGTFSKIVAAGMRLGWVVADPALIARLGMLKSDGGTSPLATHIAQEYCKDGALEARIGELIALYRHRRDLIVGELAERMPDGVTWSRPEGGFFVWLTLPDGLDSVAMLPKARERGIDYLPGTTSFFNGQGHRQIRLAYSYVTDEEMARGIGILSEVIQEELATTGRA